MKYFILNIILAIIWSLLEEDINASNLIIGFILGHIVLQLSRRALGPSPYLYGIFKAIDLVLYFWVEIFKTNLRLVVDVLTPINYMKPRIIAVPLDVTSDAEITALANLISLTPGSLSLDVSADRHVLYIHAMYAEDKNKVIRDVKDKLERRLLEFASPAKDNS